MQAIGMPRIILCFGGSDASQNKGRISAYLSNNLKLDLVPDTRQTQILVATDQPDEVATQIVSDSVLKRHVSSVRMCDEICINLDDIISYLPQPDPTRAFRLVTAQKLSKSLLQMLDAYHLHPTQFTHLLFVTPYQPTKEHDVRYLIAVREATEFWKKQFNREDLKHEHTCAAYFKLSEALQRFDVCVEGKNCIDIGAAPGGWSECLIDRGAKSVVAVDPGDLRYEHANLTHIRSMFQDCEFDEPFDLVVCDMNYHRSELISRLAKELTEILQNGGDMIMTLKGRKRGWERKAILTDTEKEVLCPLFEEVQILPLIANTKFECTLYCHSKSD